MLRILEKKVNSHNNYTYHLGDIYLKNLLLIVSALD
jgi:hypothetical protein